MLIPVVGMVLWLMWRATRPETASRLRNGFIVGAVLWVVLGNTLAHMVQRRIEYQQFSAWCTSLHYENDRIRDWGVVGHDDDRDADDCTLGGNIDDGGFAAVEDKAYVRDVKDYLRWRNGVCNSAPSFTRGCDHTDLSVQADGSVFVPGIHILLVYSDQPNQ